MQEFAWNCLAVLVHRENISGGIENLCDWLTDGDTESEILVIIIDYGG